jgi:hypothetical protein
MTQTMFDRLTVSEWDTLCTKMEHATGPDSIDIHGDLMLGWQGAVYAGEWRGWPDLLAAPFAVGCPDCGTPNGRPCAGDCTRHNDTPGDAA